MVKWMTCVVLLVNLSALTLGLRIDHLWVPEATKNGSSESAILDCDFSLDEQDKDSLEVKWYFRHNPTPIYQWIPPYPPQVLEGFFSKYVNLGYEATSDPYTKHRALQLRPLNTELSGRYACRVSSIHKDDFKAKDMIIYETPRILDANLHWINEDTLNASCVARDSYPEPTVRILLSDDDRYLTSYDITDEASVERSVEWTSAGLYNVRASAIVRFPVGLSVLQQQETNETKEVLAESKEVSAQQASIVCRFDLRETGFRREVARRVPKQPQKDASVATNSANGNHSKNLDVIVLLLPLLISLLLHIFLLSRLQVNNLS